MIIDKGDVAAKTLLSKIAQTQTRILEIGCGDGRLTQSLQGKFVKLVAIDPDAESIHDAREKFPEIDFRVTSGESPDINDGPFDIILFSLSLHHMNGDKALGEIESLLASSGQVLVLEPSVDSPISLLCNVFNDETEELVNAGDAMQRSGLDIVCSEEVHTTWVFEDKDELFDWLYTFYGQAPDTVTKKYVNDFLGESMNHRPLSIADTLILTQLTVI